jgi:quercetin dioxygenase-like cupin family protein
MCDITEKIREIAEMIPDEFEDIKIPTLEDFKFIQQGITKYKLENGYASSYGLLNHEKASIALTQIPDGSYWPEHNHQYPVLYELIIVLEGHLKMTINGEEKRLSEFDLIKIDQEIKHDALAVGDVLIIAITIPRDEGFPQ